MSSGEPRRGVGVVMRVRPTASYAHGSLMIDTDRATVELKLDASHDEVVNNQVTPRAHSTTTLANSRCDADPASPVAIWSLATALTCFIQPDRDLCSVNSDAVAASVEFFR